MKNFHPSCAISQEQYDMWSWFLVHLCKLIIPSGIFSFFWNLLFSGCYGGKRAKNSPKWKVKITSHMLCLRNSIVYDHDFWFHLCKIMMSPGGFLYIFWKFWFLGLLVGEKGKKWPRMAKNYVSHSISRNGRHMIDAHK